eukprot:g68091.t1
MVTLHQSSPTWAKQWSLCTKAAPHGQSKDRAMVILHQSSPTWAKQRPSHGHFAPKQPHMGKAKTEPWSLCTKTAPHGQSKDRAMVTLHQNSPTWAKQRPSHGHFAPKQPHMGKAKTEPWSLCTKTAPHGQCKHGGQWT